MYCGMPFDIFFFHLHFFGKAAQHMFGSLATWQRILNMKNIRKSAFIPTSISGKIPRSYRTDPFFKNTRIRIENCCFNLINTLNVRTVQWEEKHMQALLCTDI